MFNSLPNSSINQARNANLYPAMQSPKAILFLKMKNGPVQNSDSENPRLNTSEDKITNELLSNSYKHSTSLAETKTSPVKNLFQDFLSEYYKTASNRSEDDQHSNRHPATQHNQRTTGQDARQHDPRSSVPVKLLSRTHPRLLQQWLHPSVPESVLTTSKSFNLQELSLTTENVDKYEDKGNRHRLNDNTESTQTGITSTKNIAKQSKKSEEHRLRNWVIKGVKNNSKLAVQGHRIGDPPDQYWHSTAIVQRHTNRKLATGSGSVYVLVGPIDREEGFELGLPRPLITAFRNGFPPAWKELWQQHVTKENITSSAHKVTTRAEDLNQPPEKTAEISEQHRRLRSGDSNSGNTAMVDIPPENKSSREDVNTITGEVVRNGESGKQSVDKQAGNEVKKQSETESIVSENKSIITQNESAAKKQIVKNKNESVVTENKSVTANKSVVTENKSIITQNESIITQNESVAKRELVKNKSKSVVIENETVVESKIVNKNRDHVTKNTIHESTIKTLGENIVKSQTPVVNDTVELTAMKSTPKINNKPSKPSSIELDTFKTPDNKPIKSVKLRDSAGGLSPKPRRKTDSFVTPPLKKIKSDLEALPKSRTNMDSYLTPPLKRIKSDVTLDRTPGGNVDFDNLPVSRSGRKIMPQLAWWTQQRVVVSDKMGSFFDPGFKNSFIETGTPKVKVSPNKMQRQKPAIKRELNKRTKPTKSRKRKLDGSRPLDQSVDSTIATESEVAEVTDFETCTETETRGDNETEAHTDNETGDGYMSCETDIQMDSQLYHSAIQTPTINVPIKADRQISRRKSDIIKPFTPVQTRRMRALKDKKRHTVIGLNDTTDTTDTDTGSRRNSRQQLLLKEHNSKVNQLGKPGPQQFKSKTNNGSKRVTKVEKNLVPEDILVDSAVKVNKTQSRMNKNTRSKSLGNMICSSDTDTGSVRKSRRQQIQKEHNLNINQSDQPTQRQLNSKQEKQSNNATKVDKLPISEDILTNSAVKVHNTRPRIKKKTRSKSVTNKKVKDVAKNELQRKSMGPTASRSLDDPSAGSSAESSSENKDQELFKTPALVQNTLVEEEDMLSVSNYDLQSDILGMLEARRNMRLKNKPEKTACYNSPPHVNVTNVMQSRRHSEKYFLKKALMKNVPSDIREKVAQDSPFIMLSPLDDDGRAVSGNRRIKSRLKQQLASESQQTENKEDEKATKKIVKSRSGNEKYGKKKAASNIVEEGTVGKNPGRSIMKKPLSEKQLQQHNSKKQDSKNIPKKKGVATAQKNVLENSAHNPWTVDEVNRLKTAVVDIPAHLSDYWHLVATLVNTRTAAECQTFHYKDIPNSTVKKRKPKKTNIPTVTHASEITGKAGTMKRKRQLREFMENHEKDHDDDLFSSTPYRNAKALKVSLDDDSDEEFYNFAGLMYQTPGAKERTQWAPVSEKKTPLPSFVSPGILKSVDRNNVDAYINKMKKSRRMFPKTSRPLPVTGASQGSTNGAASQLELTNMALNSALFTVKEVDDVDYDSTEEQDNYFSD